MSTSLIPHVSPELARSAREHFQPRYKQRLTEDDGREIATNLIGAFAVLKEWRDRRIALGLWPPPPVPARQRKRRVSAKSTSNQE